MNTDIRTLKLVVDALRERPDFLSAVEIQGRLAAASESTVSELDTGLAPATLSDRLRETFADEAFVERVDELASDEERAVDEPELLASAIGQRVDESADSKTRRPAAC